MTVSREDAASERKKALRHGESLAEIKLSRSAVPVAVGLSRSLVFPTVMRAVTEERNGIPMHHLSGIASVTDVWYEMWDFFGPYKEKIAHDAFDESLAGDPDVVFLVNHRGLTMARTTNGTLELSSPLKVEAWLNPQRQDVKDLVSAIEDGLVDQMSFSGWIEEGDWNDAFDEFTMTKLRIDRGDVCAANYGANPHTSIAARGHQMLSELDRLPDTVARTVLRRLESRLGRAPIDDKSVPTGRSVSLVRSMLLIDDDDF